MIRKHMHQCFALALSAVIAMLLFAIPAFGAEPLSITIVKAEKSGRSVTVGYRINGTCNGVANGRVMTVLYNRTRLVAVKNVEADFTTETSSVQRIGFSDLQDQEYQVKVFAFDDFDSLHPLASAESRLVTAAPANVVLRADHEYASGLVSGQYTTLATDVVYEDSARSLKIDNTKGSAQSGSLNLVNNGLPTDWSEAELITFRLHNNQASSSKLLLLISDPSAYALAKIDLNFTGWKDVTINKKSCQDAAKLDWANITSIKFANSGWGVNLDTSVVLHLDQITLEQASPVVFRADREYASGFISGQFTTLATDVVYEDSARSLKIDNTNGSAQSGSLNLVNNGLRTDWSGAETLTFRLHNNQASSSKLLLLISDPNTYALAKIDLNFTGWQEISVNKMSCQDAAKLDWTNITSIKFANSGWGINVDKAVVLHLDQIILTD